MPDGHRVEADGYCWDCRTVGCQLRNNGHREQSQLDRIEAKLNRLLRAANLDPDARNLSP